MTDQATGLTGGDPAYDRIRLAGMLDEAAELEHSLCCQYLFAAFSMKRLAHEGLTPRQIDLVRDWETSLLMVARQEMEHLGLVTNILTAIGEAPHLVRPDFPLSPEYYELNVESKLQAFSRESMRRFVLFELPDNLEPNELARLDKLMPWLDWRRYRRRAHHTIGALYEEIDRLLAECDRAGNLFIGPESAQFITGGNNIQGVRGVGTQGISIYDIDLNGVSDLQSAQAAVKQIITEGEGDPEQRLDSHFGRFLTILEQLEAEIERDPTFAPARAVIEDPWTCVPGRGNGHKAGTPITNPLTNRVSQAFDLAYASLLLLLVRFFSATAESQSDAQALESAAFFPMMTMVIRPLGEVLTELPATEVPDGPCAGPSFTFERRVALLPHRRAAFQVIHQSLETLHRALAGVCGDPGLAPRLAERLEFVFQNVWRIAHDFAAATNLGRSS